MSRLGYYSVGATCSQNVKSKSAHSFNHRLQGLRHSGKRQFPTRPALPRLHLICTTARDEVHGQQCSVRSQVLNNTQLDGLPRGDGQASLSLSLSPQVPGSKVSSTHTQAQTKSKHFLVRTLTHTSAATFPHVNDRQAGNTPEH